MKLNSPASQSARPLGGQATLSLHGIPGERGTGTRQPTARTSRYSPEALTAREKACQDVAEQTRSSYARLVEKYPSRLRTDVETPKPVIGIPISTASEVLSTSAENPTVPTKPLRLEMRGGHLAAFVKLAHRELRPVEEVLVEWLSDCAKLIGDADLFGEEVTPPPRIGNAMLLARLRGEAAERHAYAVAHSGDYPTDYSGPCCLEVTLALES